MAKNDDIEDSEYQEGDINNDTFGLPEVNYKPLESEKSVPPKSAASVPPLASAVQQERARVRQGGQGNNPPPYDDEESPNRTWLWILLLILLLASASFVGYKYLYLPRELSKKQDLENIRLKKEQQEKDSLAKAHEVEMAAAAVAPPKKITASTEEGSIETLAARTGHYYIVISSSVDADLAMDFAKKMKRKGKAVKLMESHGKIRFTRLAIADFETLQDAREALDVARQEFGNAWVLHH